MEALYDAIMEQNVERVQKIVENGCPANAVNQYNGDNGRNIAMEILEEGWSQKTFDVIDVLLEHGLDVNHQDSDGSTILIYLLDYVGWWDYGEDLLIEKVGSKFELQDIIRLRKTFDKIMTKNPDLTISNKFSMDVFQVAITGKSSYWFETHVDQMSNEDRELYESYRLVRLFENQ